MGPEAGSLSPPQRQGEAGGAAAEAAEDELPPVEEMARDAEMVAVAKKIQGAFRKKAARKGDTGQNTEPEPEQEPKTEPEPKLEPEHEPETKPERAGEAPAGGGEGGPLGEGVEFPATEGRGVALKAGEVAEATQEEPAGKGAEGTEEGEEEEVSLESLLGSLPPAALQLLMEVEQRAARAEALALQALQEKETHFAEKRSAEARLRECEGQIRAMEDLVKQAVDMSENVAELATRLRASEEGRLRWQREALEGEQRWQAAQEADSQRQRRLLELEAQLEDALAAQAAPPPAMSPSSAGAAAAAAKVTAPAPPPGHALGWRLGSRILEEHFKRQNTEAARVTAEVQAAAEAERDTVLRYEETIRKLTEDLEACSSERDAFEQQNEILRGRLRSLKEGRAGAGAEGAATTRPPAPLQPVPSRGVPWQPVREETPAVAGVANGPTDRSLAVGGSSGSLGEEQTTRGGMDDPTRDGFGGMGSAELDARSYGACSNDLAEEDLAEEEKGDMEAGLREPQPCVAPRAKVRIDVRAVELDATQQELEALKEWKDQAQRAIVELQRQLVASKEELEEAGPLPQGVLEAVHAMRPFDGGASAPSSQQRPESGDGLVPANLAAIALAANTALERPTTAPDSQHRPTVTFWDSPGGGGAWPGGRGGEAGPGEAAAAVAVEKQGALPPKYCVDIVPGEGLGKAEPATSPSRRAPDAVPGGGPTEGGVGVSVPARPETRRGLAVPREPEVVVSRAAPRGGGRAQRKASRRDPHEVDGTAPDFMRPTLSHSASLQSHLLPGERPTSFADGLRRWKTQLRGPGGRGARRAGAKARGGGGGPKRPGAARGTRV